MGTERKGWVKFQRSWLDHPLIHKDNDYLLVWLYLITNAAIEPTPAMFGGRYITLQAGQLTTGRRQLAQATGVQEKKVYRALSVLEHGQLIGQQASRQNTLITVLIWHQLQDGGQLIGQRTGNEWAASGQQMGTLEEARIKNQEYLSSGQTSDDFDLFWEAYPKKKSKQDARRAFKKKHPPVSFLIAAIERQKQTDQWKRDDGQFIPYPATWLNGGCWDDEVTAPAVSMPSAPEIVEGEDGRYYNKFGFD